MSFEEVKLTIQKKWQKYCSSRWDEFCSSKNRFYFFYRHKMYVTALLAILTFVFAFVAFLIEGSHLFASVSNSLKIFAFEFPDKYSPYNVFMLLATLFGALTVFSAAIFTFFKEYINRRIAKKILTKKHITVFGLGEINRAFLSSDFSEKEEGIVIVESDPNNKHIEDYRAKGFGVLIGNILESRHFDLFSFENTEYALIALGNDRVNIEVAIRIIKTIKEKKIQTPTKLIVHIADSDLNEIFHQNFVLPQMSESVKVDIKTFSFFEEAAKNLFDHHNIDGESMEYIKSDKAFKSVICGDGELALSVVNNMLLLSNLPHQNRHTIYLVDNEATKFYEKVLLYTNYTKEKFPTVEIVPADIDYESRAFYSDALWMNNDLVNTIICYDKEEINLKIAIDLNDRVYLRNKELQTKVLFGMFNEYSLSELISNDCGFFDRFYTFGNNEEIFSQAKLLDEENYKIAKLIHLGYGDQFDRERLVEDSSKIDKKWHNSAKYSDKLSNIAQAKHIDLKLKALGFKKKRNDTVDIKELLEINKERFDSVVVPLLEESNLSYEKLHEASLELEKFWSAKAYEVKYNPLQYKTFFEKLIKCEHERWNSYHYLNGWEYGEKKDKSIKVHDCLKPLEKFVEPELQITILYDIYSIVYLPNYLANNGFELVTYQKGEVHETE